VLWEEVDPKQIHLDWKPLYDAFLDFSHNIRIRYIATLPTKISLTTSMSIMIDDGAWPRK
jgi:hypothetical protein